MTEHDVLMELVEVRIKRYLVRMKAQYQRLLYNNVGRGVTPEEYNTICEKLVKEGVITRSTSERGSIILHIVEKHPTEAA